MSVRKSMHIQYIHAESATSSVRYENNTTNDALRLLRLQLCLIATGCAIDTERAAMNEKKAAEAAFHDLRKFNYLILRKRAIAASWAMAVASSDCAFA